jgi:hypothetical protein
VSNGLREILIVSEQQGGTVIRENVPGGSTAWRLAGQIKGRGISLKEIVLISGCFSAESGLNTSILDLLGRLFPECRIRILSKERKSVVTRAADLELSGAEKGEDNGEYFCCG